MGDAGLSGTTDPMIPLMTSSELCDYLHVPLRTVQDWRARGVGPKFFRIGKRVYYRHDDVAAWIDERSGRVAPGSG